MLDVIMAVLATPTSILIKVGTASIAMAPPVWVWIASVVVLYFWRPVMRKIRR